VRATVCRKKVSFSEFSAASVLISHFPDQETIMRNTFQAVTAASTLFVALLSAWQPANTGQYKVVKTIKTGGLGGFDYIYADVNGRKLYIPRGAQPTANPPLLARITVFDLDTLAPAGEIPDTRANGAAVDAKSGHGFASSKPVAMWDAKTLKLIKTIEVQGNPDGILQDSFNQRIYVLSHQAPHVTVIDAKSGDVLGTLDLGGAPEQAVSDGKGHIYVDVSDKANVAVIDAKAMTVTAHYDLGDKGSGLAGLAMDVKNQILFVACRNSGSPAAQPPQPVMVILDAKDGRITSTLPLAGSSDGAVFNPATMEAFSTHGNGTLTVVREKGPASFEVEQNLDTMAGAKTLTLDTGTNHILTMAAEFGPPPPTPPAAAGAAPQGRGRGPARGPMLPDSFSILVIGK
jgi:DNA-binding beta-propeller fold protein YncE